MWDQVRVDHGKEFYLTLYIHEQLREAGRGDADIAPYMQTASTYNHIIERIWVELNHRVTYPVKRVITNLDEQGRINMDDSATKFGVSTVLMRVCEVGMTRMVKAWNSHPIPRRGTPNRLQTAAYNTAIIHIAEIPVASVAVEMYRQQGGRLTDPQSFGEDPLAGDPMHIQQRQDRWMRECAHPEQIFSELVSHNPQPLELAVVRFIEITEELAT